MKYTNGILCAALILIMWATAVHAVVSVDIAPEAYDLLLASSPSGEAWISEVIYTCVTGDRYVIVKGGLPESDRDNYHVVEVEKLKIHVPVKYNETVSIVYFKMRNGLSSAGILEPSAR